jgi:hypothetical protein
MNGRGPIHARNSRDIDGVLLGNGIENEESFLHLVLQHVHSVGLLRPPTGGSAEASRDVSIENGV